MKVLLKNTTILDKASSHFNQKRDILIDNGIISSISESINDAEAQVIESDDLYVSQSWMDLKADFRDPGFEDEEDIESGLNCAAAGGFGHVFVVPTTSPTIDSKGQVNYLLDRKSVV